MRTFIYPYNMASRSVRNLAQALKAPIIRTQNSKFVPTKDKLVINWGSGNNTINEIYAQSGKCLNSPLAVNICANKTSFFEHASKAARTPEWTTSREQAGRWADEGHLVVGRADLRGRGGEGIFFSDDQDDVERNWLFSCFLWTKYVPKAQEFRVHIVNDEIIDVSEKKLRKLDEDGREVERDKVNWRVRSYENGFIFARENVNPPKDVLDQAYKAYKSIKGLDFGAFDVIYNKKRNEAYVLECNTAPGIEGTTLDRYVEAFSKIG